VEADPRFHCDFIVAGGDRDDLVKLVEVQHPAAGAGDVRGRVGASHDDEALSTSAGEGDDLLELGDRVGLDVEFWAGVECLRPGVVEMGWSGSERNRWVELGEFALDERVHDDA
jgi:hypothetical protein